MKTLLKKLIIYSCILVLFSCKESKDSNQKITDQLELIDNRHSDIIGPQYALFDIVNQHNKELFKDNFENAFIVKRESYLIKEAIDSTINQKISIDQLNEKILTYKSNILSVFPDREYLRKSFDIIGLNQLENQSDLNFKTELILLKLQINEIETISITAQFYGITEKHLKHTPEYKR